MPTIEVSHKDLCNLIGREMSIEEIKDAIMYSKGEIDAVDGDLLKVDIKDTNRPDLWSVEGIAREIKGRYTPAGCPKYKIEKSDVVVKVDKKNKTIRPYTVCAVVKNLRITPNILSQMIQLQEKIHVTFGRNRKELAIGIYNLDRIKPPIKFTTVKPDGIKFVPLEFEEKLTPKEILEKHPKGKEYGHLLSGLKEYPIFIDSANEVLSIPPIINSDYSGKVTEKTKNAFIECSGFDFKFLIPALNVVVAALADRQATIQSVKVVYPNRTMITPDLTPKKYSVDIDYVNKISGLNLSGKKICELLKQANYDTKQKGKKIQLLYPAYRQDIMHPRDIVEDVIISYGYNNVEPVMPKLVTIGGMAEKEIFSNKVAEIMVGLGFQEILSYTLTNRDNLFSKMNIKEERIVEIENPISANWNVFRNWLLPSLMEFFSKNQHVSYPQKIFEIGDVILIDEKQETRTKDLRKLAVAWADSRINYQDIASILDALLSKLNVDYKLKRSNHSSFINGRIAE
ncbi:MAG: phenylalanine--tRNA ligase subunit beta, partial [Candidatus Aenigmatarchaeota archaeon]